MRERSAGQENLDLFLGSKVSWFGCRIDKLSADEEYIEITIKGYLRLLLTKTAETLDQV